MARSCLEVVVHDVDLSAARTTVAGTLRIIHHAVSEVNVFCLYGVLPLIGIVILVAGIACPSVSGTIEAWTSVHEMSYEVVVEAGELAAPDASVAMCSLGVPRIGETLGNGTPLHGEIVVVVEGSHLIDTPAEGTVVEDDARLVALPGSISTIIDVLFLSAAQTDEADDAVVFRTNRVISQSDARRRSSLP